MAAAAKKGLADAATLLEFTYNSPTAYYYASPLFGGYKEKSKPNPSYDLAKSKQWAEIAKYLKGECTESEKSHFINQFWGKAKTPEELYYAGFALIHGKLRDFKKGIKFLKNSAAAGNPYAARELGEIYEGYDRDYAPEIFQNTTNEKIRLYKALKWYQKAGEMGSINGKARANYLIATHPELLQMNMAAEELPRVDNYETGSAIDPGPNKDRRWSMLHEGKEITGPETKWTDVANSKGKNGNADTAWTNTEYTIRTNDEEQIGY